MAVSFVGRGNGVAGTGAISVPVPVSLAAGDLMILFVETAEESVGTPAGWTAITSVSGGAGPNAAGATRIQSFYRRATASEGSVSVGDAGARQVGQIMAFRGVVTSGNPILQTKSDNTIDASGFAVIGTWATLTAGSAIAVAYGHGSDGSTFDPTFTYNGFTGGSTSTGSQVNQSSGNDGSMKTSMTTNPSATTNASNPSIRAAINGINTICALLVHELSPAPPTQNHTIAGTLRAFSGSAEVEQSNNNAVTVDGALGAFSGSAEVAFVQYLTVSGALGAFAGEAVVTNGVQNTTLSGTLGAFSGGGDILLGQLIEMNGALGAFAGSGFVAMPIGVLGEVAPFGGALVVEQTIEATVSGELGAFLGTASVLVNFTIDHEVAGVLSAFSGAADIATESNCYDIADDKRELILRRLAEVLAAVPGVVTFGRNDPSVPESALPAVLLLDADEEAHRAAHGRGRPVPGPNWVTMRPEVHVLVQADPDELGNTLNILAERITDAVLNDATLQSLCKDDEMEYEGLGMSLDIGHQMLGELQLNFAFTYVLWPLPEPCEAYDEIEFTGDTDRECILDTLHRLLNLVPGVEMVVRNDVTVPESSTPAVVLLDGDEDADDGAALHSHPGHAPNIVRMGPEIYIIASDRPDLAGPKLNEIRMMVIRYIFNDPTLRGLLYRGDLRYEGCQTSLALGRSLTGEMGMIISAARKRD